jgi:hypothetical protein
MSNNPELTVLCVFWEGKFRGRENVYSPEWVQKLQNMVSRNLKIPHRFICLTNVSKIDGVETMPLASDYSGWWAKMEVFRPDIPGERFLYLDLDLLVLAHLDSFVNFDATFGICPAFGEANKECGTVHGFNSSVMVWCKSFISGIWDNFDFNSMGSFRGDQDYIKHKFPKATTFPKGWITKIRYCSDGVDCVPPSECKILLCMPHKNNIAVSKYKWMRKIWK